MSEYVNPLNVFAKFYQSVTLVVLWEEGSSLIQLSAVLLIPKRIRIPINCFLQLLRIVTLFLFLILLT